MARAFGFDVSVTPGAYVAYLGDGVIRIAPYDTLDPDDCHAQIVLHELCHHAVEGPASKAAWDWGLNNMGIDDIPAEWAALRVQASVLRPFGLERVLAPTTDFREAYDGFIAHGVGLGDAEVEARADAGLARLRACEGWPMLVAALQEIAAA